MTEAIRAPVLVEGVVDTWLRQEHVADKPGNPLVRDGSAPLQRWLARANRQRDLTAFEEAGHWVGGWLAGLNMEGSSATIVPDGIAWGSVSFDGAEFETVGPEPSLLGGFDTHPHVRFRLESTIVMTFTGPLAADRAGKEGLASPPPPPHPRTSFERRQEQMDSMEVGRLAAAAGVPGGVSDDRQVERLLADSTASPAEAWSYGSWLFHRAETMVRSRPFWLATCAIAEQLLKRETLNGEECIALAEETLQPKPLPDCERTWPR